MISSMKIIHLSKSNEKLIQEMWREKFPVLLELNECNKLWSNYKGLRKIMKKNSICYYFQDNIYEGDKETVSPSSRYV